MKTIWKVIGGLSLLLLGCDPPYQLSAAERGQPSMALPTTVLAVDTSLQYLYDFMRDVVADQHLTRTQAWDRTPGEYLYASESDTLFLLTLRSDRRMHKALADSSIYDANLLIPRCLVRADVETMLH